MTVYLIHIDGRYKHAGHYCGSCYRWRLWTRLKEHADGYGANLLHHARAAGCTLTLARTWDGLRADERRIKGRPKGSHELRRLCPVCRDMPRINRWAGGGVRIAKRLRIYQADHPNCRPVPVKSGVSDQWEQVA